MAEILFKRYKRFLSSVAGGGDAQSALRHRRYSQRLNLYFVIARAFRLVAISLFAIHFCDCTIHKGRFPQNCIDSNLYFTPIKMQFFGMTFCYFCRHLSATLPTTADEFSEEGRKDKFPLKNGELFTYKSAQHPF